MESHHTHSFSSVSSVLKHGSNNTDIPKELCLLLKSDSSTYDAVMEALRDYIWTKQLFDPQQMKIRCKGDALAEIVGTDWISILEIKKLLSPLRGYHLHSDETQNSPETILCKDSTFSTPFRKTGKRKAEEEKEIASKGSEKRHCVCGHDECSDKHTHIVSCAHYKRAASPMFLHIPLAQSPIESSSESELQNVETSVVTDSSDGESIYFEEDTTNNSNFLPSGSIFSIAETFELEFEPDSDLSDSQIFSDSDSSDWESIMHMDSVITFVCKTDEDQEFWADDSDDDFDAEISEFDLWPCKSCNRLNNPVNRFCLKCFGTREGWLPPEKTCTKIPHHSFPPKRKPRSKKKKRLQKDHKDSLIKEEPSKPFDLPSTSQGKSSSPHENFNILDALFSEKSDHKKELEMKKLCLVCCDRPVDACIIHGKIAHAIGCYNCLRRFKRCPVCRRTIEKVVYLIS